MKTNRWHLKIIVISIIVVFIACKDDSGKVAGPSSNDKKANTTPCLSISSGNPNDYVYIKNYPDPGDSFSLPIERGVSGFTSQVFSGSKSITARVSVSRDASGHVSGCTVNLGSSTLRYPADSCD